MKHRKKSAGKVYLTGWSGQNQVVYGRDESNQTKWAEPMSLGQAKAYALKNLLACGGTRLHRIVYKLVPVLKLPVRKKK